MPDSSDPIGTTLNGRYRLLSLLGTGASAHVYLAEDLTLQRSVAVKLLQPALADDEGFLKRFRAEARAVAALNHPNVLQVYDWGEEDSVPFLVTEYLAGGSLSDMLAAGVHLSPEQAALVGQQAAAGLAYAHQRGLVHRDVKPANLLFDDEGRLRITDFGVARALAEASWTEPIGAMIGTVRYASPEQAEGLPVDGKADVYSLGLVLYEAMTGEVPFVGETPLASLRARLGRSLPHHPALGPLDAVLSEATDPEPVLRLDAVELEQRLASMEAALPLPLPLPLHLREDAHGAFGAGAMAPTVLSFRPPSADELTQATPAVTGPVPAGVGPSRGGVDPIAPTVVAQPLTSAAEPAIYRRRRRRWPWILAVVVILAAGFGAFAVSTKLFTPSVNVPNLIGQPDAEARQALSAQGLSAVYAPAIYSTTVLANDVISQSPSASTSLKQGSSVTLVLSRGVPPVTVPSLTGLTCEQASAALSAKHIKSICLPLTAAYSSTVPAGQFINFAYGHQVNPKTVPYGATVYISISKGPPPVAIPSVSGTFASAQATLSAAGFSATQSNEFSTTVPAGQVISTAPPAGSLEQRGTTVTVYVSLGQGVIIPSGLVGEDATTAGLELKRLGLVPSYSGAGRTVVAVSPAPGTEVTEGSTVTLTIR
jgi:serine/threonine-protein kinase